MIWCIFFTFNHYLTWEVLLRIKISFSKETWGLVDVKELKKETLLKSNQRTKIYIKKVVRTLYYTASCGHKNVKFDPWMLQSVKKQNTPLENKLLFNWQSATYTVFADFIAFSTINLFKTDKNKSLRNSWNIVIKIRFLVKLRLINVQKYISSSEWGSGWFAKHE